MNKKKVVIIDYGLGNLLSVRRSVEKCNASAIVTNDIDTIRGSKNVILPGVGAFSKGMDALKSMNLDVVIKELYEKKIPLLGICLGMQLFFESSEEFGKTSGLGILQGKVIPIPGVDTFGEKLMIPNNGWHPLKKPKNSSSHLKNSILDLSVDDKSEYYFTHSYKVESKYNENVFAECIYGGYKIPAIVIKNNLFGFQFHPEKSGGAGLKLLKNFIDY